MRNISSINGSLEVFNADLTNIDRRQLSPSDQMQFAVAMLMSPYATTSAMFTLSAGGTSSYLYAENQARCTTAYDARSANLAMHIQDGSHEGGGSVVTAPTTVTTLQKQSNPVEEPKEEVVPDPVEEPEEEITLDPVEEEEKIEEKPMTLKELIQLRNKAIKNDTTQRNLNPLGEANAELPGFAFPTALPATGAQARNAMYLLIALFGIFGLAVVIRKQD